MSMTSTELRIETFVTFMRSSTLALHRCRRDGRRPNRSWAATCVAIATLLSTSYAFAGFTQRTCSSTQFDTPVPTSIGTAEFPYDLNDPNGFTYEHNTDFHWVFYTNSNVKWLSASIANPHWQTEQGFDRLFVYAKDYSIIVEGLINPGYQLIGLWNMYGDWSFRSLSFTWHSDVNNNYPDRPYFDAARPMCESTVNPTVNGSFIGTNRRNDGLLLGTGDVIYFRVTQNANAKLAITLDAIAANPIASDFDLYVSTTNATPDDTVGSYNWRGYNSNLTGTLGGAGETLWIPSSPSSRTLYIGVHSYYGAGHFTLHANELYTTTRIVCEREGFGPSMGYLWDRYKTFLARTSMAVSSATQGGRLIDNFNIKTISRSYPNTNCWESDSTCNDCITNDNCFVAGSEPGGHTYLPDPLCTESVEDPNRGYVIAHEYGHSLLGLVGDWGLPDEYNPDGYPFCGHSLMNGPNSYCHILCTGLSHCLDYVPGSIVPPGFDCSGTGSNWAHLLNTYAVPSAALPTMQTADPSTWLVANETRLVPGLQSGKALVTVTKINPPY